MICYLVNNGLNPDDFTQRNIFFGSVLLANSSLTVNTGGNIKIVDGKLYFGDISIYKTGTTIIVNSNFQANGTIASTSNIFTNNGHIYAGKYISAGEYVSAGTYIKEGDKKLSEKYAAFSHTHNYAASSHTHSNYLPTNGGSMTGSINCSETNYSVTSSSIINITNGGYIKFIHSTNFGAIFSPGSQRLLFYASNESKFGMYLGVINMGGTNVWTLCPTYDTALRLGTSNYRWNNIYSVSSSITTSDANQKNNILPISEPYELIFSKLRPVTYKFNDGKRIHTGFISQDIENSMLNIGFTGEDWAAFCKDPDEKGNYIYGLRYEEIIALNTHMIQKLMKQIKQLEEQLQDKN